MYPIYRLSTRPFQFQIYDARNKLRDESGFGQHQLFAHEFTNYLISLAVENLANKSLTKTITTCLLLIARFNILKLKIEGLKVLSCPMIVSFTSDCPTVFIQVWKNRLRHIQHVSNKNFKLRKITVAFV